MSRKLHLLSSLAVVLLWCSAAGAQNYANALVPQSTALRHGLTRAWFSQVELDRSRGHVAYITLSDGVLFVQTNQAMVHAIDAETGRTIWATRVGHPNLASLAPGANKNFLALVNGSSLYVLDRHTGQPVWENPRKLGGSPGAGPGVGETFAVIPMTNGLVEGYSMSDEAKERQMPWIFKSSGRGLIQPVATAKTISWTTDRGALYGADSLKLAVRFRLETRGAIEAQPAYWTPFLYACSLDGYLYAVDERSGNIEWKFSAGYSISQPPVAINDSVYVLPGDGGIFCVDARNGTEKWFAPKVTQFISVSPTKVYACDGQNRLVILDAKTGSRMDVMPLGEIARKLINTQSDRIYLSTETGSIQCLRETELKNPVVYVAPPLKDAIKAGKTPKAEATSEEEVTDDSGDEMEAPAKTKKPATEESDDSMEGAGEDDNPFG